MTFSEVGLDRRECLRLLLPLVAGAWATSTHAMPHNPSATEDELKELLADEVFAPARDAGKIFLEAHPEEASRERLLDRILEGAQPAEDPTVFLDRKIRADFEHARTVVLRFWVLSITECRLYAIAHLQS